MKTIIKFTTICLLAFISSQCSYVAKIQEDRKKVSDDLRTLCDSFPTPQGLRKYDSGSIIKPDRGSYTNTFKTNLDCGTAKRPYYKQLKEMGWNPIKEGSSYYFRDKHVVGVTCGPEMSTTENTVQINCSWDAYGDNINYHK